MARGRIPKEPEKKLGHPHGPVRPPTEISRNARVERPPRLRATYRIQGEDGQREVRYLAETRAWWRTWATSPQGVLFLPTDWGRLVMLAPLVDRYFRDPTHGLLAEIRRGEEGLGATVIDRRRLGVMIVDLDPEPAPVPTSRRRRDPRRLALVK